MSSIKKIAVLTSGGDSPGMNSAIRAICFSAFNLGIEVIGIIKGYEGLIDWNTKKLTLDDVREINEKGGTILFTSRSNRFLEQKYRKVAADNLRKNKVDALIVIGGDGTLRGANLLKDENVNVFLIPGTIDKDVSCSEYSLGFDTAVNVAMEAIDKIRDTGISHGKVTVVEVMGREQGHIALWSGMTTSAEATILPEKWKGNFDSLMDDLKAKHVEGRDNYLIVVAEGVADAPKLAKLIKEKTGFTPRVTALGFIQRGGHPTSKDRMYGCLMGGYAVKLLNSGKKNKVIAIKNDLLVDFNLNEALDIHNNQINNLHYELSLLLK